MNRSKTLISALAFMIGSGLSMASAGALTDQVVADLQSQGFDRIEVDEGPTQVKFEAIRSTDGVKVEVVYDSATGTIIKQEQDTVTPGTNVTPGVFIESDDNDFVDANDDNDDDGSDDSDDDGSDDSNDDNDDGSDDNGGSSGDDNDDHGGSSDHDGGDDHGGSSGGSNDNDND